MPTSIFRILRFPAMLAGMCGCGGEKDQKARSEIHAAGFAFSVDDFLRAAREGRQDVVLQFLTAGMNPDVSNISGVTAVVSAAAGGHGHVVALLLSRGAKPDASSSQGQTALMAAAQSGDEEAVKALLKAGANSAATDESGRSPLDAAVQAGHAAVVALLADRAPGSPDHALALAALHGHTAVISVLIDHGASPLTASEGGRTPLMVAAERGRMEAAKMLRQRGAAVTALDDRLQTAADYAVANGHAELAAYLRAPDRSADPLELESPPVRLPEVSWNNGAPASLAALVSRIEMFDYRSCTLPLDLVEVSDGDASAAVRVSDSDATTATVAPGEKIPGTEFVVEKVKRRIVAPRHGAGRAVDTSEMLVRENAGGRRYLVIKGLPAMTGEGCALTKIAGVDGICEVRRGDEFNPGRIPVRVVEVRPLHIVLQRTDTRETATIARTGTP